jgi:CHAD domain-containing protein
MKKRIRSESQKNLKKSSVQIFVNHITLERCDAINQALSDYFNHPDDVETVHQVRVKIRKLRGVLSFFKPVMVPVNCVLVQTKLKNLANLFGDVREADAFLEEIELIEAFNPGQELPGLKKILFEKQAASRAKLLQGLTKDRADTQIREIVELIKKQELMDSKIAINAKSYIQREIRRWIRKTQKAVKAMTATDPVSIHEVRIRCKKIRYVLESVAFMLNASQAKKLRAFESLQDDLGMLHDAYVNRDFLEALPDPDFALQKEISFFIGWQMGKATQIMKRYQS